jgi:hypothetical protein
MQYRNFLPAFLAAFLVVFVVLGLCATPAQATSNSDSYSYVRIVRLSYVSGDVQIVRPDKSGKWEPAYANMPIQQGFTLGTNNGRAEVEFENGSALWLAEKSVIQFTDLALSDGGRITKMTLTEGTASFEADIHAGDVFVVSTTKFEVTPLGKARFRVDAFSDGGSVSMLGGTASVNSDGGAKEIVKGQMFALGAASPEQETVRQNPARDSWDRWVNDRASYLSNGATQAQQYTNSPFTYGMSDLSSYGMWNYYAGCGYGWQPFGMTAGWMPFLYGQWMYYPSFGWSWVSYEPWGWMPYHFGNWMDCGPGGWMWQPGGYGNWMGAPVQWVGVGRRIGWRPNPPRVNPVHAASSGIVIASKNLGKEGRYEVVAASKIPTGVHDFSAAPLANGRFAGPGEVNSGPGGRVVVPTSASLAALRTELAANGRGAGIVNKAGAPPAVISNAVPREGSQVASLQNAAPHPAPRVASLPPARTYVAPPSSPGRPSYNPAPPSGGWGGRSASSSGSSSRSGSSPSFGSSAGRSGSSAPAPSSSSSASSAAHPH